MKNIKPYIIAEAGVNHNGDFGIAKKMVKVAAEAGADAITFQHIIGEKLNVKTKIKLYMERHGDADGIAQRVLDNLVDLLPPLLEY